MQPLLQRICGAVILGATLTLIGCSADPEVQARPATIDDILPTPLPMPTAIPQADPVIPPAPEESAQLANASTVFQTDFAQVLDSSQWQVIDSAEVLRAPSIWETRDGRLMQQGDSDGIPSMYATALVTGEAAWSDYDISVAAYPTNNDEIGVVARASDEGYYVFRVLPTTSEQFAYVLSRYNAQDASFEDLASSDGIGFEPNQWYTLRIRVQGDTIQAFLDDQLVVETQDTILTNGQAGVYGYAQGGLQFDNFVIQMTAPVGLTETPSAIPNVKRSL
ncbi:MAG: family 16 glycoside hydrolase [Chloroflexota bacterium]